MPLVATKVIAGGTIGNQQPLVLKAKKQAPYKPPPATAIIMTKNSGGRNRQANSPPAKDQAYTQTNSDHQGKIHNKGR